MQQIDFGQIWQFKQHISLTRQPMIWQYILAIGWFKHLVVNAPTLPCTHPQNVLRLYMATLSNLPASGSIQFNWKYGTETLHK